MKVLDEYPGSHHYWAEFVKEDIHCIGCGTKGVWVASEGDYYAGPEHICTNCECIFHIAVGPSKAEKNDLIKIEQLRTGITKDPSTPKGG